MRRRSGRGSVRARCLPPPHRSSPPCVANRLAGCRCGSCARPAARSPSTGRSAARVRSSTRSRTSTVPRRSRCNRSVATTSTSPCCSATSSCRHTPVGFGIDVTPGVGPTAERPLRTRADFQRLRPLEVDDVHYVVDTVRALDRGARPRRRPLGVRGRAVHRRQLPDRGPPQQGLSLHQGADAHRPGAVARADGASRRVGGDVHRGPARRRGACLPAVRLVGRIVEPSRVRAVRAAALAPRLHAPCGNGSRASPASTSASGATICSKRCTRRDPT